MKSWMLLPALWLPAVAVAGQAAGGVDPVRVEFYVMSKCPFAARVLRQIAPVLDSFGDHVRFGLEFIGDEKPDGLRSLHGDSEVEGDLVWVCTGRYRPDDLLKLVVCMSEEFREIPDNFAVCAEQLGIPTQKIEHCVKGGEGIGLLRMSFDASRARKAMGSPTMYIGGNQYRGQRSEKAFTRAICGAFQGARPPLCGDIPPPVAVPVIVLSDTRCKECPPREERLVRTMENMLPGARLERVDYATPRGKVLYALVEPGGLPAVLLGREAEQAESWERLRHAAALRGEHYVLRMGGQFDPTREICDNGVDDTGDGLVDCSDPDCRRTMLCRKEIPGKLEVFVMSQCPYAVRGLAAMREVLDRFGDGLRFEIHYIATAEGDGFRALHGQSEVDENIRQLCALKQRQRTRDAMGYIWCRGENIRSDQWKPCAVEGGLDVVLLGACADGGEGKRLLREDIGLAVDLGIKASPTWLVNNKHKFNGIDAGTITKNICQHNPQLPACQAR